MIHNNNALVVCEPIVQLLFILRYPISVEVCVIMVLHDTKGIQHLIRSS